MSSQSSPSNLALVTNATAPNVDLARAEIQQLLDASAARKALGDAIRARAEELLNKSMNLGNTLVFPKPLVETISAGGTRAFTLFASTRPLLFNEKHFIVNAEINGIKVRNLTHFLFRDSRGHACQVSRPDPKAGTLHRIFCFPTDREMLVRIFAHEAGDGQILKARYFAVEHGECSRMDKDEYEDRLQGQLIMRRESLY